MEKTDCQLLLTKKSDINSRRSTNRKRRNHSVDNKEIKLQRLERTEGKILSEIVYNAVIRLTILWGILLNILTYRFFAPYIIQIDYRVILVGYLVLSFACIAVVVKSRKPAVSFLGFTGLAIGMGILLTTFLSMYDGNVIYRAFLATGIIVVSMMIVSMIFPAFFLSIGRVLGFALLGSIVIELVGLFLLRLPMNIMDYVVVIIFAGYIGYDWAKAQAYPKTMDNAVDSAADIYVDIINIFIRILSIMGKKND